MTENLEQRVADRVDGRGPGTRPPRRRTIATFSDYSEAERAVDYLSDLKFPVERVAIVGEDLKLVEQVTGRLNWGWAAWRGALTGALPGALIGWIFGIFNLVNPLVASVLLALYGLIFGAVLGGLFGALLYAMQRGRRDFSSVQVTVPSRYEVLVDEEVADEAARLLADAPTTAHAAGTDS
jgi:hypothetical protein